MRIIGGELKGKKIIFPENEETRPLKDNVKENIFNLIIHSKKFDVNIFGSDILDLYAGSGSFGIECISRGAKKVTFVEKNKSAVSTLYKNLNHKFFHEKFILKNKSVKDALRDLKKDKFSIFFFDPPFLDENFIIYLDQIKKMRIYDEKNLVIIHRERNQENFFNEIINLIEIKEYRRSKILFGSF